ncbi:MAG: hypothetical protein EB167_00375 [Nitrososphaeria archaeon]|nr:hypothetical protein [Nitrososphaeria archaeon]NDB91168.1 hypothetical protein [Nitrososphaeria archaeon]NDF27013.1 hypothetical protein [Nitrosopumilaceae archaeon]NDF47750.1 hypothetical protein [Nitrosopumilaceae archaeon]
MKHIAILAIVLSLAFTISLNTASAELTGNKAYTLSGNGFAVSSTTISDSNAEIIFSTPQSKFSLQSGVITIDQKDWNLADLSGTMLQNGKLFKFNAKATDSQGKQVTITAVGKLVDKTSTDSIYTLNGAIIDSAKKTTKLVYTSKVSEFITKPITTKNSDITIKILKGAANPQDATYQSQIGGFKFNFLSEDRVTIPPGTTVTFVNDDDVTHSLQSGTANYGSHKKYFTADNKFSTGDIAPGKSKSITFETQGFIRMYDPQYQNIDLTVFVFDSSKIPKTKTPLN